MDIHSKPIAQRIDWLFDLARRHGETFRSPDAWLERERYLAKHPTAIVALKCMDGRVNIPLATGAPVGVFMPFRNLGGKFDLGWPHLGEVLAHHVERVVHSGHRVLILINYHYSKGDPKRGCAGFNYDTEAAIAHAYQIRRQLQRIFGKSHGTVYPLVCGFETDEDALIIHGTHHDANAGPELDLSTLSQADHATLGARVAALLPDMPERIRTDLLPLLQGNLDHIASVRTQMDRAERRLDIEHREWMICLGRGFDFLHKPNLALIIGPYSPKLDEPILTAAGIIKANMAAGRVPDDGFLLLASVPYDEIGVDRARAEVKSRFLSQFAAEVIRAGFPDLAGKMTVQTAVLDWHSRALEKIASR